ncbi:MAG: bifunctional glycosyltransferase family 2 protein/CDP-glycerol:glycerophosphate glycerophosphotransferase, partial [Eubacterium sp.]|nr:bifunctional glycosyltransferase family 2 protein/CDP-glycerol:glycerophosphate glycerophosphotransferase [Eubacterium sp.]
KYLAETLDSVFLQTQDPSAYEVIIINDGSSDNTSEIIEEYRRNYPNLIVIEKENGGPSSARNAGLDIAKGEYIFFFDADDILAPDALASMYEAAKTNHADLVIGKYDLFNEVKTIPITALDELVAQEDIDKYDPDILQTFSLSNKLFRRKLIEENHFRLPPISYSEDGAFLMPYLYHCSKITGLDQVIFHYRRYNNADATSLTSSVSPEKIKDYITAHEMIYSAARESILRDHPEFHSIEEIQTKEPEFQYYLNAIISKELLILLKRFYAGFWSIEQSTVQMIVGRINKGLKNLDIKNLSQLGSSLPELSLTSLASSREKVLKNTVFTAVLYGEPDHPKEFLHCLESLIAQNFIFIKIMVPASMEEIIRKKSLLRGNIFFLDVSCEKELFARALCRTSSPYIVFCDAKIIYTNGAFRRAYNLFRRQYCDFFTETIQHKNYGNLQPMIFSKIAFDSFRCDDKNKLYLAMDATLANKFFSVHFLKNQKIDMMKSTLSILEQCFDKGYCIYKQDEIVIFEDTEDSFIHHTSTEETLPMIKEYFENKPFSLNSPEILYDPSESGAKFRPIPSDEENTFWEEELPSIKGQPLENKVLFISCRSDKNLEGNAKALYPFIKGKKVICAQKLPHDKETALRMTKNILTSKVIVTDDYVKYLRYFPLKPEQRVIQLWHACGAFKKFGQRGTNIPIPTDLATHAQYNLVCVSGEAVRSVYADAFDVNFQKVRALGCPRTDIYFDKQAIRKKERKIYLHHPGLYKKSVLLYAPTFRDTEGDRSEFHPEIDFDRLSESLLPEQIFLICPHPVMKKPILTKKYPNILEMRDFSTNDYMLISDMLITDYSSVIFEYALLGKPIAFFCYDLFKYDRDFYLKYPEDLPGNIFTTQQDLTDYLIHPDKHVITEQYNDFVHKYMAACDGHSCERIAALINSYMEGK